MIQEVFPGIFQLSIPLVNNPLKILNSYVIKGKERTLIVDTGFRQEECREALTAALKELNVRREETDILLTHMHADHSGLAPEFVSPDGRIFVGALDRDFLEAKTKAQKRQAADSLYAASGFPQELLQALVASVPSRSMVAIPYDNYQSLHDGDVLEIAVLRLTAIHTPGHTPGHMCFWVEEHGIMFTGDHVLFDITPNITAWPGVKNSLLDYLNSLKAVRGYDVRLALPGHRQTGDFQQRIDALLKHHEDRLEECCAIVRRQPGSTVYEIASQMTWSIRAANWESFPNNQKWFAVGECMSHLDYLLEEGRLRRERDGAVDRYFVTGG